MSLWMLIVSAVDLCRETVDFGYFPLGIALGSAFVALVITGLPAIAVYGFLIWIFFRLGRFIARRIVR